MKRRRTVRTGGSEMIVGDVWRTHLGVMFFVTRIDWNGETFGLIIDSPSSRMIGTETTLSPDRFSGYSWSLMQDGSPISRPETVDD